MIRIISMFRYLNVQTCVLAMLILSYTGCKEEDVRMKVIFDTDANNELDDQHALAYLLFSGDVFQVAGITVNATRNGGDIHEQYKEAERVMRLCDRFDKIPLLKGANGSFGEIRPFLQQENHDGAEAVDFIIEQAKSVRNGKLILIPVGKLTNIALALEKEPSIAHRIRIVWLGSNYPAPGEYNQVNDIPSMNYILEQDVPFEMVTVRYGKPTGTDAVRASAEEIYRIMPGKGPRITEPVTGRHGQAFHNFGDYSVNLFEHIRLHGEPPSRALFDMAAVAIVKNPAWADQKLIPAPVYENETWIERPDNPRKITIWENFSREAIMTDFYHTMENYILAEP